MRRRPQLVLVIGLLVASIFPLYGAGMMPDPTPRPEDLGRHVLINIKPDYWVAFINRGSGSIGCTIKEAVPPILTDCTGVTAKLEGTGWQEWTFRLGLPRTIRTKQIGAFTQVNDDTGAVLFYMIPGDGARLNFYYSTRHVFEDAARRQTPPSR